MSNYQVFFKKPKKKLSRKLIIDYGSSKEVLELSNDELGKIIHVKDEFEYIYNSKNKSIFDVYVEYSDGKREYLVPGVYDEK